MVPIDAYPSALIFPLFAPPVAIVDRPSVALQITGGLRMCSLAEFLGGCCRKSWEVIRSESRSREVHTPSPR